MNTGGKAFPQHGWSKDPEVLRRMKDQGGMTLLDWYAGQALAGLLSSPNLLSALIDESETDETPKPIAIKSYEMAEAMLAEKARREATGKDSLQVPDHSPDAGKMVELQAANRELVEALEGCLENLERWCPVKHREARDILAKHKGVA